MRQTESVEETMKRVRANLARKRRGTSSRGYPFSNHGQEGSTARLSQAAEQAAGVADFPACDLTPLRSEVDGALAGHQMVGQANPRPPGIHNQAIQLVKRAMLRGLTWYTRPLHYFQGSVIRALQNTVVALKSHDDQLQELKRNLVRQSQAIGEVGRQSGAAVRAIQAVSQRSAATDDRLGTIATGQRELQKQAGELQKQVAELNGLRSLPAEQARLAQEIARLEEQARIEREEGGERLAAISHSVDVRLGAGIDGLNETHNLAHNRLEAHEAALAAFQPQFERLVAVAEEMTRLQVDLEGVRSQVRDVALQTRLRDRDLRREVNATPVHKRGTTGVADPTPVPTMFAAGAKSEGSFDYFRFEELYRGDEGLIAARQREYLGYFRGRQDVVDLGCGRGEFLELLREQGIRAKGVEAGGDQYLLCREKGLDVVQQDLFDFLESTADGALGGIFSAQVIEHLAASDQLRLVALAYRKTAPGSPVIFETINAQSVFAVVRNFFLDPTHVRPVHPETLKVAMESAKFRDVELRFSSPYTEKRVPPLELADDGPQLVEFNRAMGALNDLVYGYLDYAAIGWH
jgi:SAM-dependent methyltransferase